MTDREILLKIQRKYSHTEEFRLLMKELTLRQEEINRLEKENAKLRREIKEMKDDPLLFSTKVDPDKYVKRKSFEKMERSMLMWKEAFWDLHAKTEQSKTTS